jgi:hypothetical protein
MESCIISGVFVYDNNWRIFMMVIAMEKVKGLSEERLKHQGETDTETRRGEEKTEENFATVQLS